MNGETDVNTGLMNEEEKTIEKEDNQERIILQENNQQS